METDNRQNENLNISIIGPMEGTKKKRVQQANYQTSKMPLPCLLKEQICCHLLPLWLEGTPPLLPPKKLEQPFALSRPNPIANIPELNNIAASYIVKIIFMSMPKSIYSKLYFDNCCQYNVIEGVDCIIRCD
jgi:hypothetical protein